MNSCCTVNAPSVQFNIPSIRPRHRLVIFWWLNNNFHDLTFKSNLRYKFGKLLVCKTDIGMVGHKFVEADKAVTDRYLCARCIHLAKDPVQTACGHRYCSQCVQPDLSKGSLKCDVCGVTLLKSQVFPDKFAEREIQGLPICCLNQVHGCPWRGELRHREKHHALCDFTMVPCVHQECGTQVTRANLPDHLQSQCQYREELCSYCNQPIVVRLMKEHLDNQCPSFPVACPKCSKELPRAELRRHLDPTRPSACEKLDTGCPFNKAGCPEPKIMSGKERTAHLEQNIVSHVTLLLAMVLDMARYVEDSIPRMLNQPNGTVSKLQQLCDKSIMGIESVVREFTSLKVKHDEHETRIKNLEQRSGEAVQGLQSELQSMTMTGNIPLQEILRRVSNAEAKSADHEVLVVETHTTIEELRRELARVTSKLQESEESVRALERRLEAQDQATGLRNLAMADLEERLNDLEGCSYDGVLVWKIPQVAQKRSDARSGRAPSFYSPCFFTGPHGYKMCARIYLHGDGMGKGTHISLFFVLMRGEYDALLRWPFRQKVTMMLLDQDNEEHMIDAFRPDPASSSFQKPRAEMNIASGCPLFCSHEQLTRHAYIRDDTMFIKVIVDKPDWN